ncbi:MAG TPA: GFA family protein [Gammaproteobacteria bacterium]|nr:GFA family protein [Gammaproteobacteria bacterium]
MTEDSPKCAEWANANKDDSLGIHGGCQCGALRYRIAGPVEAVTHCHCTMCRRTSGAVVVTWLTVAVPSFTFTRGTPARYRSSAHAERAFCPVCGCQITFVSSRFPEAVDVTVGSLDDPDRTPADHQIWTENRISWLHLDEDLPAFPQETPPEAMPKRS